MEELLERQARNEALVREVNEHINTLDREAAGSGAVDGVETFRFHCECGRDGGRPELIRMTLMSTRWSERSTPLRVVPGTKPMGSSTWLTPTSAP